MPRSGPRLLALAFSVVMLAAAISVGNVAGALGWAACAVVTFGLWLLRR